MTFLREAADLDPEAPTRRSYAAPADTDEDAEAENAASYADDPLPPPARLPPASPGESGRAGAGAATTAPATVEGGG